MRTPELHYRLTNEEWNKISNNLNRAELKVLFHLRTLDPFSDRDNHDSACVGTIDGDNTKTIPISMRKISGGVDRYA